MTPIETALIAVAQSGAAGLPFSALTEQERQYLTGAMVPDVGAPFGEAVVALLAAHVLLVSPEQEAAIHAHCEATGTHDIRPATLTDGARWISSALLTDLRDGQPLAPLRSLLHSLPIRHVTPEDFAQPEAALL